MTKNYHDGDGYPYRCADDCPGFEGGVSNAEICKNCGSHLGNHSPDKIAPSRAELARRLAETEAVLCIVLRALREGTTALHLKGTIPPLVLALCGRDGKDSTAGIEYSELEAIARYYDRRRNA